MPTDRGIAAAAPRSDSAANDPKADRAGSFLAFVIPSTLFLKLNFGGELFLPEILLAGILPALLLRPRPRLVKWKWILVLGGFWLLSQIITDLVHATPFEDYSRGWAEIAFLLTNLAAIVLLVGESRRHLMLFGSGYVFGATLLFFVNPGTLGNYYPWKFGVGYPVTLAIVLLVSTKRVSRSGLLSSFILCGAAALNMFLGFRSLAGICFITALYLLFQRLPRQASRRRQTIGSLALLALVGVMGVFGSLRLYEYAAVNGMLGAEASRQYSQQSEGALGILVGGRTETLASFEAIQDSPFLGHGSWAKNASYVRALNAKLKLLGYETTYRESELIPTHSFIFGAWVEAGLMGAVFWLAILTIPVRVLFTNYLTKDPMTPLMVFVAISLIWDVFFSPLGAQGRLLTAFYLVVLLQALTRSVANSVTSDGS